MSPRAFVRLLVAAFLAFALGAPPASARTVVRVATDVLPDTVLIGQTITLRWRMWLPDKSKVVFPARPADDSLTHWRSWATETKKAQGNLREHRLTATLQSFALGDVPVPGPRVRFTIPGEPAREGAFPTSGFVVAPTVPRTGPEPPLREMKALVPPPWWALVPWLWIAVGLIVLALAYYLIRRWLRARQKPASADAITALVEAPELEARRRLEALVARKLPEANRTLEHGTELADILRRYVERRFESPRPGYTTSELARHLASRGDVDPADVARLRAILDACDLTKFARRPYDAARAHEAEAVARELIDRWAAPAVSTSETGAEPRVRKAAGGPAS